MLVHPQLVYVLKRSLGVLVLVDFIWKLLDIMQLEVEASVFSSLLVTVFKSCCDLADCRLTINFKISGYHFNAILLPPL